MKTRNALLIFSLWLSGLYCCVTIAPQPGKISSLTVPIPADNLQEERKIALGKTLFFDASLSLDSSISCASCHKPELAFTDGKALPDGVMGRKAKRNAPSLLNVAFSPTLMFDGEINTLEKQAAVPIQEFTEMGINMRELIARLRKNPFYVAEAKAIFNREFDPWVLTRSLAAYERTLISDQTPFDRYFYEGKGNAISDEAKKGYQLFSGKLYCTTCHPAPFFTTYEVAANGLVQVNEEDLGRWRIRNDSNDIGKFKVPTLRNITVTGPYMHDGRFENLDAVLDYYARGGNKGKNQHPVIQPFRLTDAERKQLKAFFRSLTDPGLTHP